MKAIEQKFKTEIEIERMRTALEQGPYFFFPALMCTISVVFSLWEHTSHTLLLLWLLAVNTITLVIWVSHHFFKKHINTINLASISRIKFFFFVEALILGLCWGAGNLLFMDPTQPYTLLIMTTSCYFGAVGILVLWVNYWPAVVAFTIPLAVTMIISFSHQDDMMSYGLMFTWVLAVVGCIILCFRTRRAYSSALHLYFENIALRQESEKAQKSAEQANVAKTSFLAAASHDLRQPIHALGLFFGELSDRVHNPETDVLFTQLDNSINTTDSTHVNFIDGLLKHEGDGIRKEMITKASHDLRQSIHASRLFFGELSDRIHDAEIYTLILQVDNSINSINSMLDALLDISKLDAGIVKANIKYVELSVLFARLESEFAPVALENNNRLQIRDTQIMVRSDPIMLERILRNLISNALKYTENGRVLVAARPRGENIEIQVLDNGTGIAKDQFDNIFVEFHQLHNFARDRRQGLGLGLAIVKRLASILKHEITVKSNLGRGSCFTIAAPIVPGDIALTDNQIPYKVALATSEVLGFDDFGGNDDTENASSYMSMQSKLNEFKNPQRVLINNIDPTDLIRSNSIAGFTILVLDDDTFILKGMRGLLTQWGYIVVTAHSSDEAFKEIDSNQIKPDLLIIDYRLAEKESGIKVAKKVQGHLAYPLPVILLTGDTDPGRLREAIASGYQLLHKPVELSVLRETLQHHLSKKTHNK